MPLAGRSGSPIVDCRRQAALFGATTGQAIRQRRQPAPAPILLSQTGGLVFRRVPSNSTAPLSVDWGLDDKVVLRENLADPAIFEGLAF